MARNGNKRAREIRAPFADLISNFRRAQSDLRELRTIGVAEPEIRRVMLLMGFGSVTPDEFLAARTEDAIALLFTRVSGSIGN